MVFSSLAFLCVFFPLAFLLHQLAPSIRVKNAVLIAFSLVFYAYGEPVYVFLMLFSTIANWLFGLGIGASGSHRAKKALLTAAVACNLALLGVFKYANMVLATVGSLSGLPVPVLDIALPVGISFYTFQAMSYVIDVYRQEVEAQRSYSNVLLYISFFPQLIAGPIIKYHDVEKQLQKRCPKIPDMAAGMRRFCFGLAKKVLIANTMAVVADGLFSADAASVNVAAAWLAAFAYLMQIYFDFSAYSDMAIGMARMFGFRFQENFRYPYAATSVKDFWRRWHISLSTWFKEYLYIPLGGNRRGRFRTVLNKIVVFFLCGLWHGANWTFVVWGCAHGLALLIEEYIPLHRLPKPITWLYTILFVAVAFVMFRAESLSQGVFYISQMFAGWHFEYASIQLALRYLTPDFILCSAAAVIAASPVKAFVVDAANRLDGPAKAAVEGMGYIVAIVLLFGCMLALSSGGYNPFIYFRF